MVRPCTDYLGLPCDDGILLGCLKGFLMGSMLIFLDIKCDQMLVLIMITFTHLLSSLQAAIAVVAARERALTVLLVAVWVKIGRIRTRLERLIALWRAGMLPTARKSRAGKIRAGGRGASELPTVPAWLLVAVREAAPYGAQLENLLSQEECKAFLAAVPQAGRLLRPLCRMLGVGLRRTRKPAAVWLVPRAAPIMEAPAGLVLGPGGRMVYV